ncbi:ubiquitin carboxyl-terminal hydrolase 15-like [Telopea speciosissima]|uniref:ubiquitin carboxyl-terminal hydrolase 15-like n=1 Tax=Telopea speciosissima TaxID=54955 RepID=UPI001CC55988|nr:ubiquitin carboxyl-terminal hydrolase 15-like [Telopea speciosissima]XP_043701655.1 ubiquitin carboxyl-terminal hydrolase 15-like [Telopea speciosissima]XP_043701656.1 ubiquitin carboxyl-terminal hydrolase 15-like [Telopea speciosissima]
MLEPREADIPVLFLVLVVLPLVTYILLGKWNEVAKKKERVSLLAQVAAEEALLAEAIATASVIPVVASAKTGFLECARCFGPAKTRCSRCKSVRYCSGKCQIIHWRMGHKEACQQLESTCLNLSPKPASDEESVYERAPNEYQDGLFQGYEIRHSMPDNDTVDKPNPPSSNASVTSTNTTTVDTCQVLMVEKKLVEKRVSSKSNRETLRREDAALLGSCGGACGGWDGSSSLSNVIPSKKASIRHKLGNDDPIASSEQISKKHTINSHDSHDLIGQTECLSKSGSEPCTTASLHSEKIRTGLLEVEMDFTSDRGNFLGERLASDSERVDLCSPPESISVKGSIKSKRMLHPSEPEISGSPGSTLKASRECTLSGMPSKGRVANESKVLQATEASAFTSVPGKEKNVLSDTIMRKMGIKKLPKVPRQDVRGVTGDGRKRNKVLFPYEEFVRLFQCEGWDLSPRGLLNCGNSCYANAVLQCLTCTKPLIIYLLQRSHSRICCMKNWCLMCELEQHVMMLREARGPLSPDKILLHMRRIGCQMGSGSQEDAHEFLRLLVTSMQSICLEGLGGEKQVNSSLQETTLIQHTFGGHLRSKVKCLICHHESERYENIMDLTLEIHGWVESLEDALTQFTAPEDLDGENMYRCGRCATYVKARKQLSIHEAPNILTIVLKRFQKGRYGKINKCITFPDMLDMIPFMTGTGDSPPLYMLYAVVVHLDTLNASFSGHYVSYVKDVEGTWFRIDDTQVQLVPTSQVMSEGAYILFYSRSCPRPPRVSPLQHPSSAMHCLSKQNLSRSGQTRHNDNFFVELESDPGQDLWLGSGNRTSNDILRSPNGNILTMRETYAESKSIEFPDTTSSDWSIFTSSDDASFTTESTRDSFSTADYADTVNLDPISSIFNSFYPPEYSSHRTVSCRRFSFSKPQTRFLSEDKGFVWDSSLSNEPLDSVQNGENPKQVSVFTT